MKLCAKSVLFTKLMLDAYATPPAAPPGRGRQPTDQHSSAQPE